jgi:UPF0755 protein
MSEYHRRHSASSAEHSHFARSSSAGGAQRFSRRAAHADTEGAEDSGGSYRPAASRPFSGRAATSANTGRAARRNQGGWESRGSQDGWDGQEQGFVGYTPEGMWRARKASPVRTVVLIVVALAMLGAFIFGGFKLAQSFGLIGSGSASGGGQEVSVFIPEGSSTAEIAKILKNSDVIERESSFIAAVQKRGVENSLQPGKYTLSTNMSDNDAIDALIAGPIRTAEGNKLTIPEGFTLEATAARVEEVCGISASEFIAEAHSADKYLADYPFLEGVYDNSMEGFLYPKTYMIPPGSNAEYVIRVLLDQFAIETAGLDLSFANSKNLTLYDVMIIASMVEKETATPEERPLVSSVIYNRLHEGMYLQICSTVVYTIGYEDYDGHPLLESDLAIESPYNTYLNAGLPAGPICSPRAESIEAAAWPAETDYLYYVLTSEDGTHTFCATYEEFEVANAAYHELFNVPN